MRVTKLLRVLLGLEETRVTPRGVAVNSSPDSSTETVPLGNESHRNVASSLAQTFMAFTRSGVRPRLHSTTKRKRLAQMRPFRFRLDAESFCNPRSAPRRQDTP